MCAKHYTRQALVKTNITGDWYTVAKTNWQWILSNWILKMFNFNHEIIVQKTCKGLQKYLWRIQLRQNLWQPQFLFKLVLNKCSGIWLYELLGQLICKMPPPPTHTLLLSAWNRRCKWKYSFFMVYLRNC